MARLHEAIERNAMDDITIARIIHIVSVLLWIGGVAFVTLVVMPSVRAEYPPEERLRAFHRIEGRFAPQARLWVMLAGASGLWMVWRGDLWDRFTSLQHWWMHSMLGIWLVFALMLFVTEPLFLHRRFAQSPDPARDFTRMEAMHRLLLLFSMVTVIGATGGSRGLF